MKSEDYIDKEVIIRSTGTTGTIKRIVPRRGANGIALRFIVEDNAGREHELMPHEINQNHDNHDKKTTQTSAAIQPDA